MKSERSGSVQETKYLEKKSDGAGPNCKKDRWGRSMYQQRQMGPVQIAGRTDGSSPNCAKDRWSAALSDGCPHEDRWDQSTQPIRFGLVWFGLVWFY